MYKKFTRSRNNKVIGGVCGGLGNYFEVDPILFRFGFIAMIIAGGSGFFIYLILLVVIPKENIETFQASSTTTVPEPNSFETFQQKDLSDKETDGNSNTIIGLLLIASGSLLLLNNLVPFLKLGKIWPVILVITGLGLLFKKNTSKQTQATNEE